MVAATLETNEVEYKVEHLPMKQIKADPLFNCRGEVSYGDVIDLAKNIKDRGLDQPIVVRPWLEKDFKYKITAGHRRFAAFEVNGADTIPAFIRPMTELEAHILNLRENVLRRDLNILQEAKGLEYFLTYKKKNGIDNLFTLNELADMFRQSRGWVEVRQELLKLPEDIQKVVATGIITQAEIKTIARLKNVKDQYELVRKIKDKRANNEKVDLTPSIKRGSEALKAKVRNRTEIGEMYEMLYDMLGPCLVTRFGAWTNGHISTFEFMKDVEKYCKKEGIDYGQPAFLEGVAAGTAKS